MYVANRHRAFFILSCTLAFLFALAACGTNYSGNRPASSPAAFSTPGATQTSVGTLTPTPTLISVATPAQNKDTVSGCPGNQALTAAPPAATVTLKTASRQTTVSKGDTVNIELPFGMAWSGPLNFSPTILAMQSPAGDAYPAIQACVWHFTAIGSGTANLAFTGRPICQSRHVCPQYVIQPFEFVVTVANK
ncbi:MAG TPA: hypothetical protein VKX46_13205 [Ktedonobacteraceae bacterium]|jgi:hypothetical protein|nr:hypothetical protein [Ktedonobacteraceae bacterium]